MMNWTTMKRRTCAGTYLQSCKSALQKDIALSRKLAPVKRTIEQVRAAIYRTGAVCLDDFQNLQDIVRFEKYVDPCGLDSKQNLIFYMPRRLNTCIRSLNMAFCTHCLPSELHHWIQMAMVSKIP